MVKAKKIKENRWRASIYLGKNEYGKKVYKDIYGTSQKECNQKIIDFMYKKENGLIETKEKTKLKTVEEFYDEWLNNRIDIRETTKKEYLTIKKCHLTPLLKLDIKSLTNSLLKKYYKNLYEKTNSNTTRRVYRLFNCFIKSMIFDPRVKLNRDILDNIILPKIPKSKHYFITSDDYSCIITYLRNEYKNETSLAYLYILAIICAGCGLRISEALAVEINDVNLGLGTIEINKELTTCKGKGYYVLSGTKTSSGTRTVVMPRNVKKVITEYIVKKQLLKEKQQVYNNIDVTYTYIDENKIELKKSGYDLLISSSTFKLIPKNTAQRHWKKIRESLGYTEQIRIHDLRRFQATLLRDNNVPEEIAKKQMGHSDAVMTRYYQNTNTQTLLDYISNINIDI